jgi:lipoprotein-anchoring transpeptidase ErfK/SrfK
MTLKINRRDALAGLGAATLLSSVSAQAHPFVLPDHFLPQLVNTRRRDWLPGDVHVTPDDFFLYFMLERGRAIRYGVGVGRAGLYEAGVFTVARKAEWPRWRPTDAMIRRNPEQYARFADGVPGGPNNPLGARAIYLYDDDGHDTYLRIHGTNAPGTIGSAVSNGCARLTNEHVIDLYPRVEIGARVYLYPKVTTA